MKELHTLVLWLAFLFALCVSYFTFQRTCDLQNQLDTLHKIHEAELATIRRAIVEEKTRRMMQAARDKKAAESGYHTTSRNPSKE